MVLAVRPSRTPTWLRTDAFRFEAHLNRVRLGRGGGWADYSLSREV